MSYGYLGGTAIGVKTDNYVILASDKMYLLGSLAFSNEVKKVYKIVDNVYLAAAGLIADMQGLVRNIRYVIGTRRVNIGRELGIKPIAKLVSVVLYSNKALPYYTQLLVGGVNKGPELYSLDSLGSIMSDKYVAIGSGAETAIGIIESRYESLTNLESLEDLVINVFKSVAKRDVLTGYSIDTVYISKDGVLEKTINLL
ncbi:TPA: proteasome subunit beta [Candidatus Geothermarchaeota archaeon]|nr:proteasome subunit beta [Candidatus Geothermarchaeota archaeon]HIQ12931.1 proteasome subunit beta [Thermoprotei archaeon]